MQLYDTQGQRLYLTEREREAFLKAATQATRQIQTFCLVLAYTGCRISEALALTPKRIDLQQGTIRFETLKKRRTGIFRDVPVPYELLLILDETYNLQRVVSEKHSAMKPIWSWSRATAWRKVVATMDKANIQDGPHKCPKGLRHGFGVSAISKGVPLNMVSKWMGHTSLEITAIYANAIGEEQRLIARKMWSGSWTGWEESLDGA